MTSFSKQEEEEKDEEDLASVSRHSLSRGRLGAPHRLVPATEESVGPIHTHSTWRGVFKATGQHATQASIRFDDIDAKGRGEGCLRLVDQQNELIREARFDLALSLGAPAETSAECPKVHLQLSFHEKEDADSDLQKSLSCLTLKEMSPLRSPTAFRSLSLSPPPIRHGSPRPALSASLPASSRRASFTPLSWASIVRGGPVELPPPSPVSEDGAEEEAEISFTKSNVATPPVGIPGVVLPNVFDEGEFPAPCSPPARPSRRRVASTGQMGAQPYLNAPPKPRAPICGSFWSHARLTVVVKEGDGKADEILDLRYYGSSSSSQAWHSVPAVATRTLASAGRRIL